MGLKAGMQLMWNHARVRLAQELEWGTLAAVALLEDHHELMRLTARGAGAGSNDDANRTRRSP
ncbi:hypothetical protein BJ986_002260 [Phycicoccus badiiscoriae]|uniref:Uncharacterized protein n=1 Tax=Pedococcus badiiscoriae TaxID=642776 RepID=A0A852WEW7_9MICO|nr:hypothetical protein [Pedococcus badiiscoriae]NYG07773.1 hypothetical protein [Pedococcus badiiscoriae]